MRLRSYLVHMETTTTQRRVAQTMIRTILKEGLAANAWLSNIQSHYMEGDRLRRRKEYFVAFKTDEEGRHALRERIADLHDEERPYLGWLKLHEMPERYADWVEAKSRPKSSTRSTSKRPQRKPGTPSRRGRAGAGLVRRRLSLAPSGQQ